MFPNKKNTRIIPVILLANELLLSEGYFKRLFYMIDFDHGADAIAMNHCNKMQKLNVYSYSYL